MPFPAGRVHQVAEILGLEGAYGFPERLLQKIWLRGDFARDHLTLTDGRPLRIRHPGRWNLLGGPDFVGAVLQWGGPESAEQRGDVELHLHAADWDAHGHAADAAYDGVILHVVLFPPPAGRRTIGAGGRDIPVLVLLPWLHRGLEEFAADEAVERLAQRPAARLPEELARLPEAERAARLAAAAAKRWTQKVRFACLRVQAAGWVEACHLTALEVLGYRYNRAPFLRIGGRWPLSAWQAGRVDTERVFAAEADGWSLQGVRPANHPRIRLAQYAAGVRTVPDWPERLLALGAELPALEVGLPAASARKQAGFGALRRRFATLLGGHVSGRRAATLAIDGYLPLLAAGGSSNAAGCWSMWEPGDLPPALLAGLRQAGYGASRRRPFSNGVAQGLLGWWLEREPASSCR